MTRSKKQKPTLTAPSWLKMSFRILEFISPFLASRLATYLFFTPIRFKTPVSEIELYQSAKKSFLTYKKSKVQIYEWGNAPQAVLLVHGWAGRATQVAHLAKPLINSGYKIIAFDAPAHGRSSGKQTSLIAFTELIQKISALHPEISVIIGHSMGGTASIHALQQGLKADKCVIIGTPAYTDWILTTFCEQIHVSTQVERLMKAYIERKLDRKFKELNNSSMVKSINTEGLIIHCEDDIDTPVDDATIIHKNWKNSTLVRTKGLGHRRILKNKGIAQSIIDFLKN